MLLPKSPILDTLGDCHWLYHFCSSLVDWANALCGNLADKYFLISLPNALRSGGLLQWLMRAVHINISFQGVCCKRKEIEDKVIKIPRQLKLNISLKLNPLVFFSPQIILPSSILPSQRMPTVFILAQSKKPAVTLRSFSNQSPNLVISVSFTWHLLKIDQQVLDQNNLGVIGDGGNK